jgi:hypothetical protein
MALFSSGKFKLTGRKPAFCQLIRASLCLSTAEELGLRLVRMQGLDLSGKRPAFIPQEASFFPIPA